MGTSQPYEALPKSILLVGDSIVLGGNPYRQPDRLGPALARASGRPVWPISAGSWGLQNELQYMLDNIDVVETVDQIVLVSNSQDFAAPSSWRSELTHPTHRTPSRAVYAFRRYVLKEPEPPIPPTLEVKPKALPAMFDTVARHARRPILLVSYPTQIERDKGQRCAVVPAWLSMHDRVKVACVGADPRWRSELYTDGIHPTPEGAKSLADIITQHLVT